MRHSSDLYDRTLFFRDLTLARALLLLGFLLCLSPVMAHVPAVNTCSEKGIGAATLIADAPVKIASVSTGTEGSGPNAVPYCLVKLQIPQAINIWVGLPMNGKWNGRLRAEGNGGYGGIVAVPTDSILGGYAGIQTDTGHSYTKEELLTRWGDFGMAAPGVRNIALQRDFAYRSQHLMAVLGKQLVKAFYGRDAVYSYWFGCSEGGREGLRMAQDFPDDYDGIVAGAPAIHWSRLAASQIWPQVVMKELAGGIITAPKQKLATASAIAACDMVDNVSDGVLTDPRKCRYSARADKRITRPSCVAHDNSCLSPTEAEAIDRIWEGPTTLSGKVLWPGVERGAPLDMLAGPKPIIYPLNQSRYWVYLDASWDWRALTLQNYEEFFWKSVHAVDPVLGSEKPDLSAFRDRGGKLVSWHGFSDPGIMPRGTIEYYESVAKFLGSDYTAARQFFRLFMAPGMQHCLGGNAPQPKLQDFMTALVDWVERGRAPERVVASEVLSGGTVRTRPLCPYPEFAKFRGNGSTDEAASFVCAIQ